MRMTSAQARADQVRKVGCMGTKRHWAVPGPVHVTSLQWYRCSTVVGLRNARTLPASNLLAWLREPQSRNLRHWAQEAGHEHETVLDEGAMGGACGADNTAPHKSPTGGKQVHEALLQEATTVDGHELELEVPPQEGTTACEHELKTPMQGAPIEHGHI